MDLNQNGDGDITEASTHNCLLGIDDNTTSVFVEKYKFTFKLSDITFCGFDAVSYFIFCSPDGSSTENYNNSCSTFYKIESKMGETGGTYSYTVDISDYKAFNTLQDISFFDIFSYESEFWCLSKFFVDGITADGTEITGYSLDFSPSIDADLEVEGEKWCAGIRINPQTTVADEWQDGPAKSNTIKSCRWNDALAAKGSDVVSAASTEQDIFEWINDGYNWVYLCVGLIGLVICCICGCAILQHIKKKKQAEVDETNADGTYGAESNRPWHGGNSAFYG